LPCSYHLSFVLSWALLLEEAGGWRGRKSNSSALELLFFSIVLPLSCCCQSSLSSAVVVVAALHRLHCILISTVVPWVTAGGSWRLEGSSNSALGLLLLFSIHWSSSLVCLYMWHCARAPVMMLSCSFFFIVSFLVVPLIVCSCTSVVLCPASCVFVSSLSVVPIS